MNILKKILFVTLVGVLFSCAKNSDKEETIKTNISQDITTENEKANENNQKIAANFEKVSLKIDGMTCEIGCARTIQSKLSKADGVKLAEVNFENKIGIVEFDANKISENEIVEIVEQIAGGDLYKVNQVEEIE